MEGNHRMGMVGIVSFFFFLSSLYIRKRFLTSKVCPFQCS